jgi:hypothetical protein
LGEDLLTPEAKARLENLNQRAMGVGETYTEGESGPVSNLIPSEEQTTNALDQYMEQYRATVEEIMADLEEDSPVTKLLPMEESTTDSFDTYMEKQRQTVEESRMLWLSWYDEKFAAEQARIQAETEQYKFLAETKMKSEESFWKTAGKMRDQFSAGISQMFKDLVRGNLNAEESFKKLGLAMLDTLIDYGAQLVVNKVLASTMQAAMVGETAAAMAAIGAAAAGPAAAVSLASFGANAGPAMAGISATHALSAGLTVAPGLEEGGTITRSGLTMVGESGPEFLNLPRGASVIPLDKTGGGRSTQINIEIYNPYMANEDQARELADLVSEYVSEAIAAEEERI